MNYSSDSISEEDSKHEIIQPESRQLNIVHQSDENGNLTKVVAQKSSWISYFCECFQLSNLKYFKKANTCLLPPQQASHNEMNTLILDLDETLVHSSFSLMPSDITIELELDDQKYTICTLKRPGLENFLKKCTELYEVVIFTASLKEYANPIIDIIDPDKRVSYRLFRDSCAMVNNTYIKDLSRLGRDLNKVIIVDVRFK